MHQPLLLKLNRNGPVSHFIRPASRRQAPGRGAIPARHLVSQRQLKGVGGDFKLVARLDFDPIRVRKRCGAEEVDVNVPRPPKLGVFEVMMFQVAYGVRHVALSRPERLLPHRPTEAVDTAEVVDIGRQFTKAQFRSQGGLSEL